ncbi:NAD(P)-dependent oxidoreductase [Streptomyces sp. NPDC021608]|uniref:NAD(P)-dependent oxidoreductase n=1 Tax=Streptomyces sp. NPDC021608 TaxID=3154903 RepID=UPI0033D921C7
MPTPVFRQVSLLPGVWPSPCLLDALRPLSQRPPLHLTHWPSPDSDTGRSFARTDALLAGWKDRLDAERLSQLPALRYVGLRATSTDRVDLDHARREGITVSPIYGYGDIGTVEFVIEQLLAHTRHSGQTPGELAGRRLGLIGYGPVARRVAAVATALGMRVLFHTPTPRCTEEGDARWAPLAEVLGSADCLSFHSPAYQHVVTLKDLRLIPGDAFVVVTTLGLPMAESDLRTWQSGRAGRVSLDSCAAHDAGDPVQRVPGIDVHDLYAARTTESVKRAETQLVQNLMAALRPGAATVSGLAAQRSSR